MRTREIRTIPANFEIREDSESKELTISGYFAVFGDTYDMGNGMTESIKPGAFSNTLGRDIRALINHDTTLVLGRTAAHTLELREDSHGLWGSVIINPKDSDAMNLYERVKRGDVNQCSFGFEILSEETDFQPEKDAIHWTITEVELYEVSVCTFPAYSATAVSAREHDFEEIKKRANEAWKQSMLNKLKGVEENGTQKSDA